MGGQSAGRPGGGSLGEGVRMETDRVERSDLRKTGWKGQTGGRPGRGVIVEEAGWW